METNNNINSLNKNEREIDIGELFNVLWIGKWMIIAITTSFSIFASTSFFPMMMFPSSKVKTSTAFRLTSFEKRTLVKKNGIIKNINILSLINLFFI